MTKKQSPSPQDPSREDATEQLASPERAREIARQKDFGLQEFVELTGVALGDYGIYHVTRKGVTLKNPLSDDAIDRKLPLRAQVDVLKAEASAHLEFPCTPAQFLEWYDATRGVGHVQKRGVSDFPLAPGFERALLESGQSGLERLGPTVPSSAIIAAFGGKSRAWWDERMRKAKTYGLKDARASLGRAQRQSYWSPTLVAEWLISKNYMPRASVIKALKQHFPEADRSFLET
jgi:hypothetical protein